MREVLSLHVGQCGVQLGSALWEHYCLEHGVDFDGTIGENSAKSPGFSSFFTESKNGKCNPRAMFVDLEPTVADQVREGKLKGLYRADQIFSWNEDAASLFPRGYYVSGKKLLMSVYDRLRLFLESFDSFQGFMLMRSIGGGTGSGYTSLILDCLGDDLVKKPVVDLDVYPTTGSGVIEPYNAILSADATFDQIGCSFMMDNEAIYRINVNGLDKYNLLSLNRLVAQAVSSITASIRFEGSLNVDLAEFQNNLVPYPKIKFPFLSYAPIINKDMKCRVSVQSITKACFEPGNRMCSVSAEFGQYLAVCLVYSGDVVQKEVISAVAHVKELGLANFVDWSPGFKIGINHKVPIFHPELEIQGSELSLGSVANSTSAGRYWSEINHRYDLMYNKAAFLHWFFIEGMEEQDFLKARETTAAIESEYLELKTSSPKL
ncbi:hypothetical protein GE061_011333 [Apolygus lucorum]|uniref:Tubulin alpha chain n=1 Tax=Apolygus lucorum TaxID=248454 RepID=A0A6A4K6X3_APOLU|nr:hypothetical protein GE061_011333 [Apolygus lucorum]